MKTPSEYQKDFQDKRKIEAINHYGGECKFCGNNNPELLLFKGDRKNVKGQIYNWLKKKNYPKGYYLQCVVCEKLYKITNKKYDKKRSKKRSG